MHRNKIIYKQKNQENNPKSGRYNLPSLQAKETVHQQHSGLGTHKVRRKLAEFRLPLKLNRSLRLDASATQLVLPARSKSVRSKS